MTGYTEYTPIESRIASIVRAMTTNQVTQICKDDADMMRPTDEYDPLLDGHDCFLRDVAHTLALTLTLDPFFNEKDFMALFAEHARKELALRVANPQTLIDAFVEASDEEMYASDVIQF